MTIKKTLIFDCYAQQSAYITQLVAIGFIVVISNTGYRIFPFAMTLQAGLLDTQRLCIVECIIPLNIFITFPGCSIK